MVRVNVEIPSRLNAAQKAKLEEFAQLCDENVHPLSKNFLDKAKRLFR
jgi:molecular chaperone DnaJ